MFFSLAIWIALIGVVVKLYLDHVDCNLYLFFLDRFFTSKEEAKNKLKGKVIWITGASSGIGQELMYQFAEAGCRLAISGSNSGRLSKAKSECKRLYNIKDNDILEVPFDISDYSKHKEAFKEVLTKFGRIDILVNNAGRSQRASFEKIDIAVDEEMFKVNVFGPINLSRLVVDHWYKKNQAGHIGVTSSVAGIMGAPFSATYSGTKYALHGYFNALQVEACKKNITVSLMCPGPVFSNILTNSFTEQQGVRVGKEHAADSKRMSTERCARLCFTAIYHKCNVVWISIQPVLICCYLTQYMPELLNLVLTKFITEKKLKQIRDGD